MGKVEEVELLANMTDTTPYISRPAGERAREADCFRSILSEAADVPAIFETFGGIGDTTEVLRDRFPGAYIASTELDEATHAVHTLRHVSDQQEACIHADTLKCDWSACAPGLNPIGIVMDFNLSTLLRLRDPASFPNQVIGNVPLERAAWVTYTDAAVAKLHLNAVRAYGLPNPDLGLYVDAVSSHLKHHFETITRRPWNFGAAAHHSRALYIRMDQRI